MGTHNANSHRIGFSQGYTPQGQKNLPPVDISGQVRMQLTGPDITRDTYLFIFPHEIQAKVTKYAAKGQKLVRVSSVKQPRKAEPTVTDPSNRNIENVATPLICLNTGKYFVSARALAVAYKLSPQMVSALLKGTIHRAKGRSFRLATPDEIEAKRQNRDWLWEGELLPVTKGMRLKGVAAAKPA